MLKPALFEERSTLFALIAMCSPVLEYTVTMSFFPDISFPYQPMTNIFLGSRYVWGVITVAVYILFYVEGDQPKFFIFGYTHYRNISGEFRHSFRVCPVQRLLPFIKSFRYPFKPLFVRASACPFLHTVLAGPSSVQVSLPVRHISQCQTLPFPEVLRLSSRS